MRRFLQISFLVVLATSCASYPEHNNFQTVETKEEIYNPFFSDLEQDYIYKASITVYDRHFGGVLVIKKIAAQHHRLVFTTEMGNKIFDFSIIKDEFVVNQILDDLNKGLLIKILKQDFKALTTEHLESLQGFSKEGQIIKMGKLDGKSHYYFEDPTLNKIVRAKHRKEKVTFLFTNINDNIAKDIDIIHANFQLEIKLKAIF